MGWAAARFLKIRQRWPVGFANRWVRFEISCAAFARRWVRFVISHERRAGNVLLVGAVGIIALSLRV